MKLLAGALALFILFTTRAGAQCNVKDTAACDTPGAQKPAAKATAKKSVAAAQSVVAAAPEGITRNQADAILLELKKLNARLEQIYPTLAVASETDFSSFPVVKLVSDHRQDNGIGRQDAPVTIVEFSDYQCSHCVKFHKETFEVIKKNYIDTGKVRFVSRDLPLPFHPWAMIAAEASRCAGEQNKYWDMRDALMLRSEQISPAVITQIAQKLSLDMTLFRACAESRRYYSEVSEDIAAARSARIPATPGFVIGKSTEDGIEGKRVMGARPYQDFETVINEALNPKP